MSSPSLFTGVDRLNGTLDYHLERQNVLVSNIAHVDTPGYVPKDLARVDQLTAGSSSAQFNDAASGGATGSSPARAPAPPQSETPAPADPTSSDSAKPEISDPKSQTSKPELTGVMNQRTGGKPSEGTPA